MTVATESGGHFPDMPTASAADLPRRRSLVSKCALLALSIGLIWLISGAWQVVAFISAMVGGAWIAILAADLWIVRQASRDFTAGIAIAGAMAALLGANVSGVLGTLTGTIETLQSQWPLLLGITFYALQVAGVASDILRRQIVRPAFVDYLLFILLGFKFYSGPLERATDLDRIVNRVEPRTADAIWEGFSWTLLGVFMKFVIANPMAELIELNTADPISTLGVAIIAELRVYFDFAGYSFMAVGLARLAGIDLTINFRQPLFASNLPDFWHRWHVSFGNWLRHYIHYPLRDALRARQIPTRMLVPLVFLVSAMWHGGTVNFAMWGAVHGLAFLVFVMLLSKYRWSPFAAHVSIITLLIFARMLTIDADTDRLFGKLADFADPAAWQSGIVALSAITPETFPARALLAVGVSSLFLLCEWISIRRYGTHDYRLFRTLPFMTVLLLLTILLVYHSPNSIFVYARN